MFIEPIRYNKNKISEKAMAQAEGYIVNACIKFTVIGYDPEDLAQELRLHLWRKLPNYNPAKSTFSTWSYVVVNNKVRDLYRKKDPLCLKHEFLGKNDFPFV